MVEKVLCFPETFMKGFTHLNKNLNSKDIVNSEGFFNRSWIHHCFSNSLFLDRPFLEGNPCFKQIIPYCVITNSDESLIFSYSRSGSEERLSNLVSIGVGGHINTCDFRCSFMETIYRAAKREIVEEIVGSCYINISQYTLRLEGLIYLEDANPVNQDHIGLLIKLKSDSKDIKMNSEGKDSEWRSKESLEKSNLEPWSKIALEILSK